MSVQIISGSVRDTLANAVVEAGIIWNSEQAWQQNACQPVICLLHADRRPAVIYAQICLPESGAHQYSRRRGTGDVLEGAN